jgi:hypothetical protein
MVFRNTLDTEISFCHLHQCFGDPLSWPGSLLAQCYPCLLGHLACWSRDMHYFTLQICSHNTQFPTTTSFELLFCN